MASVLKGLIAGLVATVVLAVIMVMKSKLEVLPELDLISMLGDMLGGGPLLGWTAYLVMGVFAGGALFVVLEPKLPGDSLWLKGVIFGVGAWLLMVIVGMPMAGTGLFAMQQAMVIPVITLMLHVIYGAVLGGVYAAFQLPRLSPQLAHW